MSGRLEVLSPAMALQPFLSLSPYLYKLTRQLIGKPVFAGVVVSKGLGVAGLVVGAQLFQSLVQDTE